MTNQIDQVTDTDTDTDVDVGENDGGAGRRRRMFLTGAGIAGAAAVVGRSGIVQAADNTPALTGELNTGDDGATIFENTNTDATDPGTPGEEGVVGMVTGAANGSHAVKGVTMGLGHAVAGDIPAGTDNTVGATWGRHGGMGAGAEGVNTATAVGYGGDANGVKGTVTDPTNGSHAVKGVTNGSGHSIAGEIPSDATDGDGLPNFSAATWGFHGGQGAGIGGESADGYGGEFTGGRAHIRLIQVDNSDADTNENNAVIGAPTEGFHTLGELFADGTGALFYYQGEKNGGWTQLNNQQRIFTDPQRAYDSREESEPANENKGRFVAGETREIDLTEFTDFPTGAKAALVNITVTNTGPIGFLTTFNGDTAVADRPNTSSVTWGSSFQRVTNSLTVRTSQLGTINVYTSEACAVVIDITGWLD